MALFLVVAPSSRPQDTAVDRIIDLLLRQGHAVRLLLVSSAASTDKVEDAHVVRLAVPSLTWRSSNLEVLFVGGGVGELVYSHCKSALAPHARFGNVSGVFYFGQYGGGGCRIGPSEPLAAAVSKPPMTDMVFDDAFGVSCMLEAIYRGGQQQPATRMVYVTTYEADDAADAPFTAAVASSRISEQIVDLFDGSFGVPTVSVRLCGRDPAPHADALAIAMTSDQPASASASASASTERVVHVSSPLSPLPQRCGTSFAQLVVFSGDSDPSWTDRWAAMRVVYATSVTKTPVVRIDPPSSWSDAYLVHILRFYPDFPEVTVFCQGNAMGGESCEPCAFSALVDAIASRGVDITYLGLCDRWGSIPRRDWDALFADASYSSTAGGGSGDLRYNRDGLFAVGRERLLAHPRDVYLRLLDTIRARSAGNRVGASDAWAQCLWTPLFAPQ